MSATEKKVRLVGMAEERSAENAINDIIKSEAQDGWRFVDLDYRSFEFNGIRHSAALVFERTMPNAAQDTLGPVENKKPGAK